MESTGSLELNYISPLHVTLDKDSITILLKDQLSIKPRLQPYV